MTDKKYKEFIRAVRAIDVEFSGVTGWLEAHSEKCFCYNLDEDEPEYECPPCKGLRLIGELAVALIRVMQ